MKKLSILLSIALITALCFSALVNISEQNRYTSVRKYTKPKPDTVPPTIEFLNYKDGDVTRLSSIDIQVSVADDRTARENIVVEGVGKYTLKTGFNPIVVSARDEAGNISSAYIIIEKK